MRIIAGQYGGRIIATPRSFKTHPMSERIRGALFNSLADIREFDVWDAFAGSGALAIESVSRGARFALATDSDRVAYKVLKKNSEKLAIKNLKVVKASCQAWGKNNREARFDLILCDPPYNDPQLSTAFALKDYLKPKGLMVISYPGRDQLPDVNGVVVVDNRNYGDAALAFCRLVK